MTTRKELQEWLNQFPEDTIIEFGFQEEPVSWESNGAVDFKSPQLEDNEIGKGWEFVDFRDNRFVKPEQVHFGKCFLKLGEKIKFIFKNEK